VARAGFKLNHYQATGPEKELLKTIERIQSVYRLTDADIQQHIEYLQSLGEIVVPAEGPPIILKCPDDDPVVYTALAGAADVICTVDRHFYEPNVLQFCSRYGIRIMDDVELLRILRQEI
jgi:predicted nucleic acid-binding protein